MGDVWRITEIGNRDRVNILDQHGDPVAWGIERHHAETIVAGQQLLAAAERDGDDR